MKKLFSYLVVALLFCASFLGPVYAAAKREQDPRAPNFPRGGEWLNTTSLNRSFFQDKVTLVYFWDYTSINVIREVGMIKKWYQRYRPYGFEMIWVHAPEYGFAQKKENIESAAKRLGIYWPVYLDDQFKLWDAYKTRLWPTKYLVDRAGGIFYTQAGEGNYVVTEEMIRRGLRYILASVILPEPVIRNEPVRYSLEKCGTIMAEMPIGYKRFRWWGGQIANRQWVDPGGTFIFKDRGERVERGFFVEGLWTNHEEAFIHARETDSLTDYLGLLYQAHEVYTVASHTKGARATRIYVTRNNEPVPPEVRGMDLREDAKGGTYFLLQEPRLYYLIANEDEDWHELRLWPRGDGVAINSFSFSNRCLSDFEHL